MVTQGTGWTSAGGIGRTGLDDTAVTADLLDLA